MTYTDELTWEYVPLKVSVMRASDDIRVGINEPAISERRMLSADSLTVDLVDPYAGEDEGPKVTSSDALTISLADDESVLCIRRGPK